MRLVDVSKVSSSLTMWNTQNCNRVSSPFTFSPMYVFPVPGGPWMTANSLVSAICMALYWESSSSRSSAEGHKARFVIGTSVPLKKERCVFSHAFPASDSFWKLFCFAFIASLSKQAGYPGFSFEGGDCKLHFTKEPLEFKCFHWHFLSSSLKLHSQ